MVDVRNYIINDKECSKEELLLCVIKEIADKKNNGVQLKDFDVEDWKDVLAAAGLKVDTEKIGETLFDIIKAYTPIEMAQQIAIAGNEVAKRGIAFKKGEMSELDFLEECQLICLEATVRAISNYYGTFTIDIPQLGIMIEDVDAEMMFNVAKKYLDEFECMIIESYLAEIRAFRKTLDDDYMKLTERLAADVKGYMLLLDEAFSSDAATAVQGSVKLAEFVGVTDDEILHNKKEVDDFFL